MSETTTLTHGDMTFEVAQAPSGEYYCPRCKQRKRLASLQAVSRHLVNAHGLSSLETRTCSYCSSSFRVPAWETTEYCSMDCSNKDDNGYGQSATCRYCGTFLSSDVDDHCEDCSQIAAIANGETTVTSDD